MFQRTRIKICGLRQEADVECAVEAGADAVGFVFYNPSPRYVSVSRACELARRLPPFVTPVGLFVNADAELVNEAICAVPQLVLQFHGDESSRVCESFGRPFLRAARMQSGFDLLDFCAVHSRAQAILLDADVEGYGGGGQSFDWTAFPWSHPLLNASSRLVLSGGLTPANVIDGITCVRPWAVDVSSGVESASGIKDADAIHRFCDAVREADARSAASMT